MRNIICVLFPPVKHVEENLLYWIWYYSNKHFHVYSLKECVSCVSCLIKCPAIKQNLKLHGWNRCKVICIYALPYIPLICGSCLLCRETYFVYRTSLWHKVVLSIVVYGWYWNVIPWSYHPCWYHHNSSVPNTTLLHEVTALWQIA